MADDSEEACLVNPKSSRSGNVSGCMQYTDGLHPSDASTSDRHGRSPQSSRHIQSSSRLSQDTGDQYDINDDIILSQFHADAIKQAGCGRFQFIASIIVGLGLAGHVIQIYSIFYILPSAEVEYCIYEDEKNWVSNITLLGIGCGALLWGALAGKNGRRKALLGCLAVSGVFSVIAAFMPTYGPFMMARFCAAIGIGGTFPSAASYLCEITPLSCRARIIAFLITLGVCGGIFAGAVAMSVIPSTGQMIVVENREHFSAWHRYLLLMTIIPIISTISMCWLPESPRFLLANGNEVEALATYQQIYKTNRSRGGYALTELELPGVRGRRLSTPSSVLASMLHNISACCSTFVQLYNEKYGRTSLLLMGSWMASVFVFHGLTIYISEYSKAIEKSYYDRLTVTKFNLTYQNVNFQTSLDNMIFDQCTFRNCTFRHLFTNHVLFNNSILYGIEFSSVKTSRTEFLNSTLTDMRFIDTEISKRNFINCTVNNSKIIRINGTCDMDFDYNVYATTVWKSNLGGLIPCILAILSVGEAIQRLGRATVASCCYTIALFLCIILGFVAKDELVIWIGGCAQGFILAAVTALTVFVVETYTTSVRCTALGVLVCVSQIGALLGALIYSYLPTTSTKFAATLSTTAVIVPVIWSMILKDPCLLV